MVVIRGPDDPQRVPARKPDEGVAVVAPGGNEVREVGEVDDPAGGELLPGAVEVLVSVDPEGSVLELLDEVGHLQELPQLADGDQTGACVEPSRQVIKLSKRESNVIKEN